MMKMRSINPKKLRYPYFKLSVAGRLSLRRNNRPTVYGIHSTADERHGHGQRYPIGVFYFFVALEYTLCYNTMRSLDCNG